MPKLKNAHTSRIKNLPKLCIKPSAKTTHKDPIPFIRLTFLKRKPPYVVVQTICGQF